TIRSKSFPRQLVILIGRNVSRFPCIRRYKRRSLFQEIRKTRKTRKTRCQKIRKQEECQWRFLKLYIIEFTYDRIRYNRISTQNIAIFVESNFIGLKKIKLMRNVN
ncbi:hypothetical protein BpHYR1_052948, partial [Brachionus plicatilis]